MAGAVWRETSFLLHRACLSLYSSAPLCRNIAVGAVNLNQCLEICVDPHYNPVTRIHY